MDTIYLANIADEEDINVNDRMAINAVLKKKINEMIVEAKNDYLERVGEEGSKATPMLPLIRLRVSTSCVFTVTQDFVCMVLTRFRLFAQVDTTGIPDMTNPQRLGLEFQGKIANPRDVLQFIRPKTRSAKNAIAEPELEIDNLDLGPKEKASSTFIDRRWWLIIW
jgi:double-strand break repair protein MRE11